MAVRRDTDRFLAYCKSFHLSGRATLQGTEDLEEVLSERLQQLPQPLIRYGSDIESPGGQGPREEDIFAFNSEEAAPAPSQVRPNALIPCLKEGLSGLPALSS